MSGPWRNYFQSSPLPVASGREYQPLVRRFGRASGLWIVLNLTPGAAPAEELTGIGGLCGELTASERAEFEVRATSAFLAAGLDEPDLTPTCTRAELAVSGRAGAVAKGARARGRLVDELLELVTVLIDRELREQVVAPQPDVLPETTVSPEKPGASGPSPPESGSNLSPSGSEPAPESIALLRPEVASQSSRASHRAAFRAPAPVHQKSKALGAPESRLAFGFLGALWATEVFGAAGFSLSERTVWNRRFGFSVYLLGLVGLDEPGGFRTFLGAVGIGPEGHLGQGFGLNGGILVSGMYVPSPVEGHGPASSVHPGAYLNLRIEKAFSFGTGFAEVGAQFIAVRRELRRGDVLEQTVPAVFPMFSLGLSAHLFGPRSSQGEKRGP